MKLKTLLFSFLAISLLIMSCGEDDPVPTKNLEAAFDITTVEDLTVNLTNKSMDADSYSWNFGDGNTSTETSPSHTYANGGTYTITLTATGASETKTASKDVTVSDKYAKDGYVVVSVATSSGGSTYYAGYYPQQPTGNLDLTTKQGFLRFATKANYKGYIYGRPSDGETGLAKYAVENATGNIVTVAELALLDVPGDVTIINDELGFVSYFGLNSIQMFNPMTMTLIGDVNMSGAKAFPEGNDRNGYNSLIYNEKLGKIYATAYTNNAASPPFYDAEEVWIEVIDLASKAREKTIVHSNAKYILDRGNINSVIDEEGNTYFLCQGSYGIDQQVGPAANVGSRPQIIKVNTSSEFDESYAFNPINSIGFQNNFFQLMASMVYAGNNTAYAIGTSQVDSPEIQALLGKLAQGTITAEEYDQLVFLVLYTENMSVLKIDLNSKSVEVINNTSTAGFAYPYMYNTGDKIITQITKQGGVFNGFYEIDKSTGAASELCNITAGGVAVHYVNLADGFE